MRSPPAGSRVAAERGPSNFAIEQTERAIAPMQQPGSAGPSLALLMGEKTPVLIGKILAMMKESLLALVGITAKAALRLSPSFQRHSNRHSLREAEDNVRTRIQHLQLEFEARLVESWGNGT